MILRTLTVVAVLGGVAVAQPKGGDKVDAKALMQSGVKLLEAKDYLGALAVFRDAYARFPSAKILLNIGTTLKLLNRNAEAANTYQRYLDAKDADAGRRGEIAGILADIDKTVGVLQIGATPSDAEIQVNDEPDWVPAASAKVWRIAPGKFSVRARKDGFQGETKSAQIAPGEKASLVFVLSELPKPETKPTIITVPVDNGVRGQLEPDVPRARVGALVAAHVDVAHGGSAVLVGATGDVTDRICVHGAVMFGPGLVASSDTDIARPKFGGYLGASYAFLDGSIRPLVAAGMPVFASNGPRYAVRGAAGVEYVANRHVALILELGLEENLNPENDIKKTLFVPSVGASGRL
jgi:hypothetical protein